MYHRHRLATNHGSLSPLSISPDRELRPFAGHAEPEESAALSPCEAGKLPTAIGLEAQVIARRGD
jgi:hypothetical protein